MDDDGLPNARPIAFDDSPRCQLPTYPCWLICPADCEVYNDSIVTTKFYTYPDLDADPPSQSGSQSAAVEDA
jgi:hypothetical protein